MRLNIRRKNILTLYKFYIIFILVTSLVNINKGFGMEEAKNNLMNTLISLRELVNKKSDIKVEQIQDYLDHSKKFLYEYFRMQKFTDIFFDNYNSYGHGIYQILGKQIDSTKNDMSTLQSAVSLFNNARGRVNKTKTISDLINTQLNYVFGNPIYRSLVEDILNRYIHDQKSVGVKIIDNTIHSEPPKYNALTPSVMALSFIRESSDIDMFLNNINFNEERKIEDEIINEKETIVTNLGLTKLNKKISNVFFNSKRLAFQQISQQLLRIRGINTFDVQNLHVDYISNTDETDYNEYMTFSYNNQRYKLQQKKKTDGVNFGFILEIYRDTGLSRMENTKQGEFELDGNYKLIDRFFIKKYHKGTIYTKANNVGSKQSLETKIPTTTNTDFIVSSNQITSKKTLEMFLDIKEPFIYKVLEQLKLGPEVHFIINPYNNRGFYSATKDISGNGYFSTVASMEGEKTGKILTKESKFSIDIKEDNSRNLSIGLSELNLFCLMCSLGDLNPGNYGYIFASEEASKNYDQDTIDTRNFKIIDLAQPHCKEKKDDKGTILFDEKYEFGQNIENILNSECCRIKSTKGCFVERLKRRLTNIDIMKQALSQFEERLQKFDTKPKEDVEDHMENDVGSTTDNENARILEHLLQQQSLSIKTLMQTRRDDIPILKNRTNAELIGFKNGSAPNDVTDPMEQLQYLDNAFRDLDVYSKSIVA